MKTVNPKILMVKVQLLCILIFLSVTTIQIQYVTYDDQQVSLTILAAVAYAYILHFTQQRVIFGAINYFSFGVLFPFGYLIVYFQLAALDSFGFSVLSQFENFIWAGNHNIAKTISIAGLGIVAFFLGVSGRPSKFIVENGEVRYPKSLVQVLTYLSIFFYILFLSNSGSYIFGAYVSDGTWLASYSAKLFNVSLFSALGVELHRIFQSKKRYNILTYLGSFHRPLFILTAFHILFSIFVGDRAPVMTYSILLLSTFFIKYYRLSFFKIVILLVFLSAFFTILGEARTRVIGEGFAARVSSASQDAAAPVWFDDSVPGSDFIELALSVRTLAVSIRDVPQEFSYQNGMFQIQQIVSVIPGLQGIVNKVFYGGNNIFNGSANFITYLIHRRPVDYGDGSSVIADLYLDFGAVGVIVVMFLFGRFMSRIESDVFTRNIKLDLRFLVFLSFIANSIYLSRSTIMLEFSNILLSLCLIKLVLLFLGYSAEKRLENPLL